MEKNTNELILERLLKIDNTLSEHGEQLTRLNKNVEVLETKIEEGFDSLREAINYIGNKVFDNHEHRIKALEAR